MNDLELVCSLVVEYKCSITARGNKGATPMHIAVSRGHIRVLKKFVQLVPNVSLHVRDDDGNTLLHFAIRAKHLSLVHYCIDVLGLFPSVRNNNRMTPAELHTDIACNVYIS